MLTIKQNKGQDIQVVQTLETGPKLKDTLVINYLSLVTTQEELILYHVTGTSLSKDNTCHFRFSFLLTPPNMLL